MGRSLMSCKDVSLLISLGEDQCLTVRERMMVRIHLFFCEACSRFRTQIRFVDKSMAEYLREQPGTKNEVQVLSEEARNRIRRAMDEGSRE
ncbi:MAG: zf-HC2 domain-containing protein [Leptospirales bacterium]